MCGIVGLDMKMSCNGCRVLRKGCSDDCIIRPCLYWIKNAESQANATVFLAKFYGRAGLMNLISAGPEHLRPAIFKSLLYEACGRLANPINGSIGLLSSGNWQVCQQAVDNILKGTPIEPLHLPSTPGTIEEATTNTKPGQSTLMEAIANELHKVKTKGRFKKNNRRNTTTIISNEEDSVEEENAASQVSNLRGRRCYPGENLNTISSDSSCETHNHDYTTNKDYNAKTKFSMPLEVPKEEMKPPCNSNTDVELELTLSSHALGETHKQRRQVHDEQKEKVHGGGGLLLSEEYCKTMHCSSSSMFASSGLGLGLAAT